MIMDKTMIHALVKENDELKTEIGRLVETLPKRGEWIPVSERLPEEGTRVLISLKIKRNKEVVRSATYYDDGHFHSDTGDYWNTQKDVELLAWMPLPEPYKADKNGDTK